MRPKTVTAETIETLRTMKADKSNTYADIASHTGVSRTYLRDVARDLGLTKHQFAWTEEAQQTVREMWNSGHSAQQISNRLGNVSRNAVIGKVRRMGLPYRQDSVWKSVKPKQTKMQRRSASAKKARRNRERFEEARAHDVATLILPSEQAPPNATSLLNLRNDQCRWPYGDGPFLFCPETKVPGLSYCLGHAHKSVREPVQLPGTQTQ